MSTLSAVRREHSERAFSKVGVNFLDARDVRLTAILIKQLGTTKKEYTKSAQNIRESAERIARQFHHRQVSDDIFVLAMILDCDGAKEIRKHGIDPLEPYKAAMEPLRMLPAPLPAEASSHVPVSDTVEKILAHAQERAATREEDMSIAGVEDLLHGVLKVGRDSKRRSAASTLHALDVAKKPRKAINVAKPLDRGTQLESIGSEGSRTTVLTGVLVGCGVVVIASCVALLASKGILSWSALTSWLT